MSARLIRRARARKRRGGAPQKAAVAAGAALGATIAVAPAAEAATFEVENLEDDGAGSLRQAIEDANTDTDGDQVVFQSGLTGTITLTSGEIDITEPIEITGPGAGVITVSGNDNAGQQIFEIASVDSGDEASISGLTLTEGAGSNAGAIRSDDTNLTLAEMLFVDNHSQTRGGALYSDGGTLEVVNSTFADNAADNDGGAIGIFNTAGEEVDVSIRDSVFTGNQTDEQGGALYLASLDGGARVERTTFIGNSAGAEGGAIYAIESTGGDTVFDGVTIAGNAVTDGDGGGIQFRDRVDDHQAIVQNATVSGNTATGSGGGIAIEPDEESSEDTVIRNSTIVENAAGEVGGGIFRGEYGDGGSDGVLVSSTIVANNTASVAPDLGEDPAIDPATGAFNLGFSLLETGGTATVAETPAGSNVIGQDPLLGPLADNGGPTRTHAPATNSPALDKGVANGFASDQRGLPRIQELSAIANAAGGDGADIGAVELQAAACRGASVPRVDGTEANDTLAGTVTGEAFFAGGGNDAVNASGGKDCVSGDAGKDRLKGGASKDQLNGAVGRDRLKGGGGKDRLKGGPGKDKLVGGPGKDRFSCGPGKDKVTAGGNDRVSASCEKVVQKA